MPLDINTKSLTYTNQVPGYNNFLKVVDRDLVSKILHIVKKVFSILGFIPFLSFSEGVGNFSGIVANTLSGVRHIKKLNTTPQPILNKLMIITNAVGLVMEISKEINFILNVEQFLKNHLSFIRMPNLAVHAPFFPFFCFINLFQVMKEGLDISIALIKIHHLRKDKHNASFKKDIWKKGLSIEFIESKLDSINEKKEVLEKFAQNIKLLEHQHEIENKKLEIELLKDSSNGRVIKKIKRNVNLIVEKHQKAISELPKIQESYKLIEEKISKWEFIHELAKQNLTELNNRKEIKLFCKKKVDKWEIKKTLLNWDLLKKSLSIAIHTCVIITIVASIILAISGIATLPSAVILSSLFVLLSLASLSLQIFNSCKKEANIQPVLIPRVT